MNILDTNKYYICLRFRIDNDAPIKYVNQFNDLKALCEYGKNKEIVEQIKSYCKLEQNKNLPYLERIEGGFGGNNNLNNKQIRFKIFYSNPDDKDILLNVYNSNIEKWTYDELDDIIYGFIKIANKYVNTDCINGCIEFVNKKSFNDNYLDSD